MSRVVFMGTPEFAVPTLQKLAETQDVVGVVTQPDRPAGRGREIALTPVKIAAQVLDLPVYQPATLRTEEAAEPLRRWSPEAIVVAAFGQILRPHLLELPRRGCINVHASLLPRWRGAAPIQHAILAGDRETGVSLMKMDEGLDTGPVYVREAIAIKPTETASSLHDRLALLGAELLGRHLDEILAGTLAPTPQDDKLATYARMLKKEDGRINWDKGSQEIDRLIRAMTPWPGAFTHWQKQRLKIRIARPVTDRRLPQGVPGQVVNAAGQLVVLSGDGGVRLDRLQLAGKRAMMADEFLRGQPDLVGSVLG